MAKNHPLRKSHYMFYISIYALREAYLMTPLSARSSAVLARFYHRKFEIPVSLFQRISPLDQDEEVEYRLILELD
jgi:hypothetical protein